MKLLALRLALLLIATVASAAEVTLRVVTDRRSLYHGEGFVMSVLVGGVDDARREPDISAVSARASIRSLGSQSRSSSSITIINGKRTEESFRGHEYRYLVTPSQTGTFKVGPISFHASGKTVTASAPPVEVIGIEKQDSVLLTLTASRETVLVGESFSVLVAISVLELPEPYAAHYAPLSGRSPVHLSSPLFEIRKSDESLTYPDLNEILGSLKDDSNDAVFNINDYMAESHGLGFASLFGGDPFSPRKMRFRFPVKKETIGGKKYVTYSLLLPFVARREGELKFGPLSFKGRILSGGDKENPPQWREIYAIAPVLSVNAAPPPVAGRPASFIGAIATECELSASLDSVSCKVGDPLTFTLEVTGDFIPESVRPPKIEEINGIEKYFRLYDDSVKTETLKNGRRFTYRVRPTVAGTLEFPPVEVAYFDVEARAYRVVKTEPIPLRASATVQIVAGDADAEPEVVLPVHGASGISVAPEGVESYSLLLGALPVFYVWMALAIPPLFFLSVLLAPKIARAGAALFSLARRNNAASLAVARLRKARSTDECAGVIRDYLALAIAPQARRFTPLEVEKQLRERGCGGEVARGMRAVLEELDEIMFNPDAPCDVNVEAAVVAIRQVDAAIGSARRSKAPTKVVGAIVIFLAFAFQLRADEQLRDFLWESATVQATRAADTNDFAHLAATYERLVDDGARNGALFYNLANAYLLAGELERSKQAFLRAERYWGSSFPVRTGIACIDAIERGASSMEVPWSRIAFFWHYMLPCHLRFAVVLAAWVLLWPGMLVRLRFPKKRVLVRSATVLMVVAALALVFFGASVAVSVVQEQIADSVEVGK